MVQSSKRIYGLDILRAIAIITVLVPHSGHFLPESINSYLQKYSIDGVSIFFVLSGFLIGSIILKTINQTNYTITTLFIFWTRRWLRTLPAFFTVIVILLLVYWYRNLLPSKIDIIECITFTQSLLSGKANLYNESWSLAVEEWFYFLVPLLLFFIFKMFNIRRQTAFLLIIIFIIVACTAARMYITSHIDYKDVIIWDDRTRKPVFLRLDSIMLGVLGAYLYFYQYKIWNKKRFFFWIGISIFFIIEIVKYSYMLHFVLSLECIGTLCLLPMLNSIKSGKGIIYKTFTFISIISYSLYLLNATPFNDIIFYPLINRYFNYPYVAFVLFYIWAFIGSYFLYMIIEKPFMDMRNKIPNKRVMHPIPVSKQ